MEKLKATKLPGISTQPAWTGVCSVRVLSVRFTAPSPCLLLLYVLRLSVFFPLLLPLFFVFILFLSGESCLLIWFGFSFSFLYPPFGGGVSQYVVQADLQLLILLPQI